MRKEFSGKTNYTAAGTTENAERKRETSLFVNPNITATSEIDSVF
jgi:hypothetical protein